MCAISRQPGLRLAGVAVLVPGRGAAGRREREGREQDRDPRVCPLFLTPMSLCFFDKNLKGERAGIREKPAEAAGSPRRGAGQGCPSAEEAQLTSLKMIHTGESVWMDNLMASSGPKDGSTSPSATPLEKEPGRESMRVARGQSPGSQPPPKRGLQAAMAAPCPQLPNTRERAENQQCGHQYSAKCYTEGNKKIS